MIAIVITAFCNVQYASDSWLKKCNFKEFFSFHYGKVGDIRDQENLLCGAELGKLFSEVYKQINNLLQLLCSKKDTSNWIEENYSAINACFFKFLNRSRKPLSNCI